MRRFGLFILLFWGVSLSVFAKPPELTEEVVVKKSSEIMRQHAQFKELTPELTGRILVTYLEEIDPTKTYLTEEDISLWLHPSPKLLNQVMEEYRQGDFSTFFLLHQELAKNIDRRHRLEEEIAGEVLPEHVDPKTFRDAPWAKTTEELKERIKEYQSLQADALHTMEPELKDKALQRIQKKKAKYEEDMQNQEPKHLQATVLANVLKALAASLDTHTAYLTPEEAKQFMINVQQRLLGIGVQLRDDINGFSVVKILEGGPAARSKLLKAKDRIIAVDAEPVVGMDIADAVELIRGKEGTWVTLTVVREEMVGDEKREKIVDVPLQRGEVVLTESRYKASFEPFGAGGIAVLRLYSFYQDKDSSSAQDLQKALDELREKHKIEGVILDLRQNSGGLLSQAVQVTGLFITKGIVVSIKDESGHVSHLRDVEGNQAWAGPLLVLVDRTSASASEIVAQTLQDYGRAIVIGDDHTYGKGSFQTFTLDTSHPQGVNPEGEYKVTRGRYYTVSGKTPQMVGVASDIVVPGLFSETELGEKYQKFPLENDEIPPNFVDQLADIPLMQRLKYESFYKFNLQPKLHVYEPFVPHLQKNSAMRMESNQNYQNFLSELKKRKLETRGEMAPFGQNDLQLEEAVQIMKDLLLLLKAEAIQG